MSTDGTKPPSIAPRGGATGTAGARPRPPAAPRADATPPSVEKSSTEDASTQAAPAKPAEEERPSIGERLKKAATSAVDTAKNAVPTREPQAAERREPARSAASASSAEEPREVGAPRKVRLAVARIDPWSVMKLAFLLSVAIGIMIVVAAAVVWFTLDGLEVFTRVNDTIAEITGNPEFFNLLEYVAFDRVVSLATMIAVVDVVLLTALATIGAFLYNIVATLVGGISVTLTDD